MPRPLRPAKFNVFGGFRGSTGRVRCKFAGAGIPAAGTTKSRPTSALCFKTGSRPTCTTRKPRTFPALSAYTRRHSGSTMPQARRRVRSSARVYARRSSSSLDVPSAALSISVHRESRSPSTFVVTRRRRSRGRGSFPAACSLVTVAARGSGSAGRPRFGPAAGGPTRSGCFSTCTGARHVGGSTCTGARHVRGLC